MQNDQFTVASLGGSGEEARNCFLVESGGRAILLDCGVRREALGAVDRVYPAVTENIAARLDAVFLSHAHEDHVAALPYLYELGYRGPVYGTGETIRLAGGFMKKWADYVTSAGGTLPFSGEAVGRIKFCPLSLGPQIIDGIHVVAGRSGHMLGSCWLQFEFGDKTLLYTGDMALDGRLLATDLPPQSDAAVIDCAYAGRVMSQDGQYGALLQRVRQAVAAGGKVLLPVPPNGRGSDILLYLCGHLADVTIYAEANVVSLCGELLQKRRWLREGAGGSINAVSLEDGQARMRALSADGPAVYLTGDGMMSGPTAAVYFEALKGAAENCILITGHTAEGALGSKIFDPAFCAQAGMTAAAERLTIKVHLDNQDVIALNQAVRANQVLLFHAPLENTQGLVRELRQAGVDARCGLWPQRLEI
ncbi:MAG: MBL fold metallo-hydrolase [Enterocloster asparagiformis]|nr:MBL fold metallo-hydrolase [Enterocloster asparagiformis]